MKRISFLGAGSWGTALAILCANNGHRVVLWSATNKFRKKREHVDCLPGMRLPDSVKIEDAVEEACKDKDIIAVSVASPYMRSTARLMKPTISFFGLSRIGDLIVTCTSTHSRNHNCGYLLGKGKTRKRQKRKSVRRLRE